jgi:cytochrome c oxidase subunit II
VIPSPFFSFRTKSRQPGTGKLRLSKIAASLALFATTACSASAAEPMRPIANMFDPLSTPARMIHESSIVVLVICAIIFVIVSGMLFYVTFKFRSKGAADERQEPPQIYGSSQIELAWTVIPILITIVLILVTTRTIGEIQDKKIPEGALQIRVIGHQWWWEIQYLKQGADQDSKEILFTTADEIHVPLNKVTEIFLESADVIHSFWVPQLNGKTDVVPNHKNSTWVEPHAVGTYFGNCAEYCGTQHAKMLIRVIVDTEEDFDKWMLAQQAPPPEPLTPEQIAGKKVFYANSCVNCHKVDGSPVAVGVFGPDLTHLMSRQTLASGAAPLNKETLHSWITDPEEIKPGSLMPNMQLTPQQVDEVVAYLMTLK